MTVPAATPLLVQHDWQVGYRHEDGDLIELFYNPALACAVQYDRMTGYFSAGVLRAAARGIDSLIANGGRMRLLVGCQPDIDETTAIMDGYDLRAQVEQKLLGTDLNPSDRETRTALELLAWMVANNVLDVKVAVPLRPDGRPERTNGIYHEMVGILTDAAKNRLCFCGSINETEAGWVINRESFDVYCSWQEQREQLRLQKHAEAFETFWSGKPHSVAVYDFPQAVRDKLLSFLPTDSNKLTTPRYIPDPEPPPFALTASEKTRIVWAFVRHAAKLTSGLRVAEATSAVTPWPHQLRTMHRFLTTWPARILIAEARPSPPASSFARPSSPARPAAYCFSRRSPSRSNGNRNSTRSLTCACRSTTAHGCSGAPYSVNRLANRQSLEPPGKASRLSSVPVH